MKKWLYERLAFLTLILLKRIDRHYFSMVYAMLAHAGQKYDGHPYFLEHLLLVYREYDYDSKYASVAWLHDLLEDTKWPLPFWLTEREREAIQLLTRKPGVPYFQYVHKISVSEDRLAFLVKEDDIRVNISHSRRGTSRWRKYDKARRILWSGVLPDPKYLHRIEEDDYYELDPI